MTGKGAGPAGEIAEFASANEFAAWMEANHAGGGGIWLKVAKRSAHRASITYAEALDVALCYGWIDGQKAAYDQDHWLQRFTPRTRRSKWSQVNREKAELLIAEGRMRPAGLAEVARARDDGRWDSAYAGQRTATVPDELQRELDVDPTAAAAFSRLDARNRYSIIWRINDAKRPETRARRVAEYLDMLRRGERIHERP